MVTICHDIPVVEIERTSSSSSRWFIVIIKTKKRNDNNGKTKEWPYGALNHFKTHEIK